MKVVRSIGGISIRRQPTNFSIEKYDLTKSGRVASGKMTIDIVAKKRKFNIAYDVISGPDMEALLTVIDSWNPFFTFEFTENGVDKTATVYAGAKKAERFRTDGKWYWKNFTFDLIEQ